MSEQLVNLKEFLLIADNHCQNAATLHDERSFDAANRLLDRIIAFEYTKQDRTSEKPLEFATIVEGFLVTGAQMLENASVLLCIKFAQAVGLLIQNNKVTLKEGAMYSSVRFFLSVLGKYKSSLTLELLNVLYILLQACTSHIEEETMDVLFGPSSPIWRLLFQGDVELERQKACLQLVTAVLPLFQGTKESSNFYIKIMYQQIFYHLRILVNFISSDDLNACKMVFVALQALHKFLGHIKESDNIIEPEIIIALLKVFLCCGLPGCQSKLEYMRRNLPTAREEATYIEEEELITRKEKSPLSKKMVSSAKIKKKKSKNKNKKKESSQGSSGGRADELSADTDGLSSSHEQDLRMFDLNRSRGAYSSSESELSDAEQDESIGLVHCKVRCTTLRCIQSVLKSTEKKVRFSCWLLLLPENKSDIDSSLLSTLKEDQSPKVRLAAFNTLLELIDGSKIFLDMAMARSANQSSAMASFVSYSTKLRQSVDLLHSVLMERITREPKPSTREKAVKCLTLLVLNCPYDKLGIDWLKEFIPVLSADLTSSDPGLLISVMTCLAAILSVRERTGDMSAMFRGVPDCLRIGITKRFGSDASELESFGNAWLTYFSYKLIETCEKGDQVSERYQCEGLQVLTVILRMYPELINHHCRRSATRLVLQKLSTYSSIALAFDAIKFLEEIGKYFARLTSSVKEEQNSDDTNEGVEFWEEVIPGPVIALLQSSEWTVKVKSAICDWIATVGPDLFPLLQFRFQIMCKTMLLGTAQDIDDQIKAAAVRALGVLITYPCMREDPAFVMDTCNIIIDHLNSSNVALQMKAAWAIGNLCDSCVKNNLICPHGSNEGLPQDFVHKLLVTSANASRDSDKIKSNGVRAVGNLIRSLPKYLLDQAKFQEVISESAKSISNNIISGPMKGRWNACYACSNIFCNENLEIELFSWQEDLFKALLSSLKDCKNFKVRIGATSAFRTLKARSRFATTQVFVEVWQGILQGLATSENMADFREFRYKDLLQTQICDLLCHLINLADPQDLEKMQLLTTEQYDLLTGHLYRYFARTRHPPAVGSASNEDTSNFIPYNEKLVAWEAFKASFNRITCCPEMEALIKKINIMFR